jgi:hypothetical protein
MLTISDVMKMKDRKDVDGLIRALQDQDIAVRAEAASSLGQLGDQKAVAPLISTLQNDSDPYVRSLAAKALGSLGNPRARDALMNCLANDSLEVSAAAGHALGQLEAEIATGNGVSQNKPVVETSESGKEGCAGKLWRAALWIGVLMLGIGCLAMGMPLLDRNAVVQSDYILITGVFIGSGVLLLFISTRSTKSKKPSHKEKPQNEISTKKDELQPGGNVEQLVPEPTNPDKGEEEGSNKIGSVDILWVANKAAVSKLTSLAAASGLSLRGAVSATMGMSGSRDELIESANKISLSPVRKVWCETTPIYRDKRGGGIYVLFEKLDDDICNKKGLEFLGTIDAKDYAAALCMAHGLDTKSVFV